MLVDLLELLGQKLENLMFILHLITIFKNSSVTKEEDANQIMLMTLMVEILHLLMEAFNLVLLPLLFPHI